jgi:hypothetical protein
VIPPLVLKGDPGIDRPIVIDGEVLSIMPREMTATPEPLSGFLPMLDGGEREFQMRPHFDGIANHADRYTFSIPYDRLRDDNRVRMERIRVRGGTHRVVLWRMVPVIYTVPLAGLKRYYFPRFRKCAAHVYDGLDIGNGYFVSTDLFPTFITLNGAELVVTYAGGPTLADPGAGAAVIAREPDVTGAATDYTAFMLGDAPDMGDEIEVWSCFAFDCSLRRSDVRMVGPTESHAYTFVEV